jgi:hypothetical protein
MTVPHLDVRWRKSSRSGQDTSCVELSHPRTAVRDSKNPAGPTLWVDVDVLLSTVKVGRFDR